MRPCLNAVFMAYLRMSRNVLLQAGAIATGVYKNGGQSLIKGFLPVKKQGQAIRKKKLE